MRMNIFHLGVSSQKSSTTIKHGNIPLNKIDDVPVAAASYDLRIWRFARSREICKKWYEW